MSWSIGLPVEVHGDSAEGDLADIATQGQTGPHVEQALAAAKKAAVDLIRSGAVGHPGRTFIVSLSGHANPDHAPTVGWSNDFVTINVAQKS